MIPPGMGSSVTESIFHEEMINLSEASLIVVEVRSISDHKRPANDDRTFQFAERSMIEQQIQGILQFGVHVQ
jgi:hypothetical protein